MPPNDNQLSDVERRALQQEFIRRQRLKEVSLANYQPTTKEIALAEHLESLWYDKQSAFFTSPHRRKVGFCTRRAGKTVGSCIYLLAQMLRNPEASQLYIAQTSGAARSILWPELKRLIDKFQLPLETNETHLWVRHPRAGGLIILKGADKADEIEKYRGMKLLTCVLDEAATYGKFVEALILESIGPTLRDLGGTLIMIGTAGRKKEGLFYEAAHGIRKRRSDGSPVYEVHKWSLVDNPFLSADAKDLDLIIDEEGFAGYEDPRFQREYLGNWIIGEGERMFAYQSPRNDYEGKLPVGHDWKYLLGMDFGWHDESAITVVAYAQTCKTIYFVESWSKRHAYADDIAFKVMEFRQKYGVTRYIGDTGGAGTAYVKQMARDYGIHVQAAKKQEKLSFIEFMNSAFARGEIMVKKGDPLAQQFSNVEWNDDHTDAGKHERDDLCFSAVYGWRYAKYSGAGKKDLPIPDDRSAAERLAIKEKLDVLRKTDDGQAKPWWDIGSGSENAPGSSGGAWGDLFKAR